MLLLNHFEENIELNSTAHKNDEIAALCRNNNKSLSLQIDGWAHSSVVRMDGDCRVHSRPGSWF